MNHERWLISYADFITLLFAFFVVMFAISQVDADRLGRFSESVREATRYGVFEPVPTSAPAPPSTPTNPQGDAAPRSPDALDGLRVRLQRALAAGLADGRIEILRIDEGLVVRFREAAFFDVGSAEIRREHVGEMVTVARTLADQREALRIEGHTDPTPIHTVVYRSNWDLSAARATSVLEVFASSAIALDRMSVAGYADQRPISENATPDGRRQNRRVDVVVLHAHAQGAQ